MFQQLVTSLGGGRVNAELVLTSRPSVLAEYLEQCWILRDPFQFEGLPPAPVQPPGPQVPPVAADDNALRAMGRLVPVDPPPFPVPGVPPQPLALWPHLAYAYMLEQTRMVSVFRRLLELYVHGSIPLASAQSRDWVRATEELFFAGPRLPAVYSLDSQLRPDGSGRRRNAYFRLLGMDLTHGCDDGRPYPYVKPDRVNRDFAAAFEVLLREVWRAYTNRNNVVGPDSTDDIGISDLLRRLFDMLTSQRLRGALAREEFEAVALMSWLNLTLAIETQVIDDLLAQGSSAAERLMKISQRVGVTPHVQSDSYFQMAMPLSNILRGIESGAISGIPGAQMLYLVPGAIQTDMLTLINHWSIATGRSVKESAPLRQVSAASAMAVSSVPVYGPSRLPATSLP